MHVIRKKLAARRGETVAEVLLAVLIAGVSMAMLAVSVNASSRLNAKALRADETLYASLAAAEGRTGEAVDTTLSVTASGGGGSTTFAISIYGADGDLQAYESHGRRP